MATPPTASSLRARLADLAREYDVFFAGQPRGTRDLPRLDHIIRRARALAAELSTVPPAARSQPEFVELGRELTEVTAGFEREVEPIIQAKGAGAAYVAYSELDLARQLIGEVHRRHFTNGPPVAARDTALLAELVEELRAVRGEHARLFAQPRLDAAGELARLAASVREIDTLVAAVERVKPADVEAMFARLAQQTLAELDAELAQYEAEAPAIVAARAAGTPGEQARAWAQLANGLIRRFETNFTNQPRALGRPALLQRIIDELKKVRDAMAQLKKELGRGAVVERDHEVVSACIARFGGELGEVKKARIAVKRAALIGLLGEAANAVMDQYDRNFAGQDRATRDLLLLGRLADRMREIAFQMAEIARSERNETNARNLAIVTANRAMLEREHRWIEEARRAASATTTTTTAGRPSTRP